MKLYDNPILSVCVFVCVTCETENNLIVILIATNVPSYKRHTQVIEDLHCISICIKLRQTCSSMRKDLIYS